ARPRSVVLVVCAASAPRSDRPRTEIPETPVYYLARAPVGSVLSHSWLLQVSRRVWDLAPVRYAAPLRDLLVYGSFENLKGTGRDLCRLRANGDRISYPYEPSGTTLARYRQGLAVLHPASTASPASDSYLSRADVQGLRELADLTDGDGCARIVIGHDQ